MAEERMIVCFAVASRLAESDTILQVLVEDEKKRLGWTHLGVCQSVFCGTAQGIRLCLEKDPKHAPPSVMDE